MGRLEVKSCVVNRERDATADEHKMQPDGDVRSRVHWIFMRVTPTWGIKMSRVSRQVRNLHYTRNNNCVQKKCQIFNKSHKSKFLRILMHHPSLRVISLFYKNHTKISMKGREIIERKGNNLITFIKKISTLRNLSFTNHYEQFNFLT